MVNPCPQCTSRECGPIRCRFTGLKHPAPRRTPPLSVHDFRDTGNPLEKVDRFTLPAEYTERGVMR